MILKIKYKLMQILTSSNGLSLPDVEMIIIPAYMFLLLAFILVSLAYTLLKESQKMNNSKTIVLLTGILVLQLGLDVLVGFLLLHTMTNFNLILNTLNYLTFKSVIELVLYWLYIYLYITEQDSL